MRSGQTEESNGEVTSSKVRNSPRMAVPTPVPSFFPLSYSVLRCWPVAPLKSNERERGRARNSPANLFHKRKECEASWRPVVVERRKQIRKKMFFTVKLPGGEWKVLASPRVTQRCSVEVSGEGPQNPSIPGDGKGRRPQGWGMRPPSQWEPARPNIERPTQILLCGYSLEGLDGCFQIGGNC